MRTIMPYVRTINIVRQNYAYDDRESAALPHAACDAPTNAPERDLVTAAKEQQTTPSELVRQILRRGCADLLAGKPELEASR